MATFWPSTKNPSNPLLVPILTLTTGWSARNFKLSLSHTLFLSLCLSLYLKKIIIENLEIKTIKIQNHFQQNRILIIEEPMLLILKKKTKTIFCESCHPTWIVDL